MEVDLQQPISNIMATDIKQVDPDDETTVLKNLFEQYRIHHVPVTTDGKVVGIISKSDFLFLLRGFTENDMDRFRESAKLRAYRVSEIMHKEVTTIRTTDSVQKAVTLLAENRFRALPVVDEDELLRGIVTTHDIIDLLNR